MITVATYEFRYVWLIALYSNSAPHVLESDLLLQVITSEHVWVAACIISTRRTRATSSSVSSGTGLGLTAKVLHPLWF